ncbi:MAG: hypothetical protein M3Z21_03625 [Pseudomonadota bacterium]|nr:hypothetical protein [Pseudomonadota bacterium]
MAVPFGRALVSSQNLDHPGLVVEMYDELGIGEVSEPGHFDDAGQKTGHGCRLSKDDPGLFYPAWARTRFHWPLPLAADAGLSLQADEPELETGDERATAGDNSLRAQCRRMVRVPRSLLRAHEPPPESGSG